jgi:hypothetical protein
MGLGQQINLDKGEGKIMNGEWVDSVYSVCTRLSIEFISESRLYFTDSNECYITYRNIDWIPLSFGEIQGGDGTWTYNMICNPKNIYDEINKPCINTALIAASLNLTVSEGSDILPVRSPVIGYKAGEFLQEVKRQSFNKAFQNADFGDAYFLYMDSKKLCSATFKALIRQEALSLEDLPCLPGQNIVKYVQDAPLTEFRTARHPQVWTVNDCMAKMFRQKFDITTVVPAALSAMYTIKFTNTSELDQTEKFMCIRTSCQINKPMGYTNTFAKVFLN